MPLKADKSGKGMPSLAGGENCDALYARRQPPSLRSNTKIACNRYGSNSGSELAKSRGFEQKAVSTVQVPHQSVTFFKNGESFGRKKSIRLIS